MTEKQRLILELTKMMIALIARYDDGLESIECVLEDVIITGTEMVCSEAPRSEDEISAVLH